MKIAIIGSGISGLATAYFLSNKHEVWLFEAADYLGGHSHTVCVKDMYGAHNIDTGFIVCNKRTYPNFMHLLQELNVNLQKSSMGFSVKDAATNFEFAGTNLNTIFAKRSNILNYKFWHMLFEIKRFNDAAKKSLQCSESLTLQNFLTKHAIGAMALQYYVLPLVAAIWSTSVTQALDFPTNFLFEFLNNHGLLDISSAPQWYTIKGGSIEYVKRIHAKIGNNVFLNNKVHKVLRIKDKIKVITSNLEQEFDKVVFAVHSDQVLSMLEAPSRLEEDVFNNILYQESSATLHTDTTLLPNNKRAWASWNYFINNSHSPNLTYNMNILQSIPSKITYCVSLNLDSYIHDDKIIAQYKYSHPVYNQKATAAQKQWSDICCDNIYYCGAYWGYGFHEDGINSAIRVVDKIDKEILCNTPYTKVL